LPNWCSNTATITFKTPKEATQFVEACKEVGPRPVAGTLLDMQPAKNLFQHYLPEPDNTPDWYSWRVNNWGIKWPPNILDVCTPDLVSVIITFESPWCPPTDWFEHCGMNYDWEWHLEYIECGACFAGVAEGNSDGITFHDEFQPEDGQYVTIAESFGIELTESEDDDAEPAP